MADTPEGRVKAAIKLWLRDRGVWFYMPVQTGYGVGGVPDFICCWGGQFMAIEAKAPGKRKNTSEKQKLQIEAIRAADGLVLVVDDVSQLEPMLLEELR